MIKIITFYALVMLKPLLGIGIALVKMAILLGALLCCEIMAIGAIISNPRSFDEWKYNCDNDGDMDD